MNQSPYITQLRIDNKLSHIIVNGYDVRGNWCDVQLTAEEAAGFLERSKKSLTDNIPSIITGPGFMVSKTNTILLSPPDTKVIRDSMKRVLSTTKRAREAVMGP